MSEWKVEKSHRVCTGTGREIPSGEPFWSRLVVATDDDGRPTLVREDYLPESWPPQSGESLCFWQVIRRDDEDQKPRMLDTDSLLEIFQGLNADSEEPRKVNFRYLLALILMRKKILKETPDSTLEALSLTDGVSVWTVLIPVMDAESRQLAEEDIGQLIVNLPEPSENETSPETEPSAGDAA